MKFLFEGEEEVGGVSLPQYVDKYKELFKADMGVWESGDRHETERPAHKTRLQGNSIF